MMKYSRYDDSFDEDDDTGLLKQALRVEMSEDFNPDKAPQTGEEYLQHVVYERTRCKTWVTANIDRSKFTDKQTLTVPTTTKIKTASSALLPTSKWQTEKIEEFTNFRKFIRFRMNQDCTVNVFDEETFLDRVQSEYPQFSQITTYTQAAKMRKLHMISKSLDSIPAGQSINSCKGAWIYAILTLLEIPLSPDSCFSLREFAKRCLAVRAKLDEDAAEELYVPLNLFVCIVARFYNQLDLADG